MQKVFASLFSTTMSTTTIPLLIPTIHNNILDMCLTMHLWLNGMTGWSRIINPIISLKGLWNFSLFILCSLKLSWEKCYSRFFIEQYSIKKSLATVRAIMQHWPASRIWCQGNGIRCIWLFNHTLIPHTDTTLSILQPHTKTTLSNFQPHTNTTLCNLQPHSTTVPLCLWDAYDGKHHEESGPFKWAFKYR